MQVAQSGDPRLAWIISDMMRFISSPQLHAILADASSKLVGKDIRSVNAWGDLTDHLIAWDVPAPPDYLETKRAIFTGFVPSRLTTLCR